jgi:hypothetical protein
VEVVDRLLEQRRLLGDALVELLLLQQIQGGEGRGAGNRVRRVGVAVEELQQVFRRVLGHEGVVDLPAGDHRAHGDGAVGDLLGHVEDVRHHAEGMGAGRRRSARTR